MKRMVVHALVFLSLAILQTSLIASLPGLFAYTPIVLAAGVFLSQQAGLVVGAVWISSFGVFTDLFAVPSFPFETAAYIMAGLSTHALAQNLFSNRSWYGLMACGTMVLASLYAVRAVTIGIISLRTPDQVSWDAFGVSFAWNAILLLFLLSICFAFARRLKKFLRVG